MIDHVTQQSQGMKQIESQQKLDYDIRKIKRKNPKDAVITVCIFAVIVIAIFVLAKMR